MKYYLRYCFIVRRTFEALFQRICNRDSKHYLKLSAWGDLKDYLKGSAWEVQALFNGICLGDLKHCLKDCLNNIWNNI